MNTNISNVLIAHDIDSVCAELLRENGINVCISRDLSENYLVSAIENFDGLIGRSSLIVTSKVINAAKNLKIIARAGVGIDNVDMAAASNKGIIVMNSPLGNTRGTSELACAMILALSRNLHNASNSMKNGEWKKKNFIGNEVYQKTLAIVGLGNIGREVACRMQSFGMKTVGYDPMVSKEEAAKLNIEWMELDELWSSSDYISLHVPLIPATEKMINKSVLVNKCKKGVKIVNCARGEVIDENDLLYALNEGFCDGVGLDVFSQEPPLTDNLDELIGHEKVLATPHLGAQTLEAQFNVAKCIAEQFLWFSRCERLCGAVNADHLRCLFDQSNSDLVTANIAAGKLAAQWVRVKNVKVHSLQLILNENDESCSRGLLSALCYGLMFGHFRTINMINSCNIASENNIKYSCKFSNEVVSGLICLVVKLSDETNLAIKLCASVVGPFLVETIIKFRFPALLKGTYAVVENVDEVLDNEVWNLDNVYSIKLVHENDTKINLLDTVTF